MNQPAWLRQYREEMAFLSLPPGPYGKTGYTGAGRDNKIQAAAPVFTDLMQVHEGEYVVPNDVVKKHGGPGGVEKRLGIKGKKAPVPILGDGDMERGPIMGPGQRVNNAIPFRYGGIVPPIPMIRRFQAGGSVSPYGTTRFPPTPEQQAIMDLNKAKAEGRAGPLGTSPYGATRITAPAPTTAERFADLGTAMGAAGAEKGELLSGGGAAYTGTGKSPEALARESRVIAPAPTTLQGGYATGTGQSPEALAQARRKSVVTTPIVEPPPEAADEYTSQIDDAIAEYGKIARGESPMVQRMVDMAFGELDPRLATQAVVLAMQIAQNPDMTEGAKRAAIAGQMIQAGLARTELAEGLAKQAMDMAMVALEKGSGLSQSQQTFMENRSQFNQTFTENKRQFDEAFAEDRRQYEDREGWTAFDYAVKYGTPEEVAAQYYAITGKTLDPEKIAEMQNQYKVEQGWKALDYALLYGSDEDVLSAGAAVGLTLDPASVEEYRGFARTITKQKITNNEIVIQAARIQLGDDTFNSVVHMVNNGAAYSDGVDDENSYTIKARFPEVSLDTYNSIYNAGPLADKKRAEKMDAIDTLLSIGGEPNILQAAEYLNDVFPGMDIDFTPLLEGENAARFQEGMGIIIDIATTPGMTWDNAQQSLTSAGLIDALGGAAAAKKLFDNLQTENSPIKRLLNTYTDSIIQTAWGSDADADGIRSLIAQTAITGGWILTEDGRVEIADPDALLAAMVENGFITGDGNIPIGASGTGAQLGVLAADLPAFETGLSTTAIGQTFEVGGKTYKKTGAKTASIFTGASDEAQGMLSSGDLSSLTSLPKTDKLYLEIRDNAIQFDMTAKQNMGFADDHWDFSTAVKSGNILNIGGTVYQVTSDVRGVEENVPGTTRDLVLQEFDAIDPRTGKPVRIRAQKGGGVTIIQ